MSSAPPSFAELDAVNQAVPTNFDVLDQRMAFASDSNAIEHALDSKLFVKFYYRQRINEEKSKKAGRAIHESVEFINIKLPGDKHNDVNRPSFPEDRMRFALHYERFRKNQEQIIGTPLSTLPFLNESQIEDYKVVNIHTVEQLASLPDVHAQKLMGSITHKGQAQEWLNRFNSVDKVRAEFEAKDKKRDEEMAALRAQIAALSTKTNNPSVDPVKPK